jgi:cytoskeletal protein RodZ
VREVPQGDGGPLSCGAYLKQSRVLRELSLEEVATATKLPARIVKALEADDFTALRDRQYALLAARSIAAAIGLDPEETALRLEEDFQRRTPAESAPAPLWSRLWKARPREPIVWVVVGVTLCACAALLLRWH